MEHAPFLAEYVGNVWGVKVWGGREDSRGAEQGCLGV